MKELGAERRAVDGLGRATVEMDPYLAWTLKVNNADADGTQHDAVLRDPAMHRCLEREGIEVRVKDAQSLRLGVTGHLAEVASGALRRGEPCKVLVECRHQTMFTSPRCPPSTNRSAENGATSTNGVRPR